MPGEEGKLLEEQLKRAGFSRRTAAGIGAGVVILGLAAYLYKVFKPESHGNTITANTVNGPAVNGNNNQIVVQQPASLDQIKQAMREVMAEREAQSRQQLPNGYQALIVTPKGVVTVPSPSPPPKEQEIEFAGAQVVKFNDEVIEIVVPHLKVHTATYDDIHFVFATSPLGVERGMYIGDLGVGTVPILSKDGYFGVLVEVRIR